MRHSIFMSKLGGYSRGQRSVGDLVINGFRDLVVDIACTHEFGGSHLDVSLNGQLRDMTPTGSCRIRHTKRWSATRDGYDQHGTTLAILPCAMTSSGKIHGEFLRFLYILAHRRSERYCASLARSRLLHLAQVAVLLARCTPLSLPCPLQTTRFSCTSSPPSLTVAFSSPFFGLDLAIRIPLVDGG